MPFFILSIVMQAVFVIHILKTGRNTLWVWIVILIPFAGVVAYLIVELLPEFMRSQTGRKANRKVRQLMNPHKSLNEAIENYGNYATVENAMILAGELAARGQFEDAKHLYEKCLKGVHQFDPHLMYGLAQAEFGLHNAEKCKAVLDELIQHNPEYKNADAHLLYARALEQVSDFEKALSEYEVLDEYYPGVEASYHYAKLLLLQGNKAKARDVLQRILSTAKKSGRHYNEIHQKWIALARSELAHC